MTSKEILFEALITSKNEKSIKKYKKLTDKSYYYDVKKDYMFNSYALPEIPQTSLGNKIYTKKMNKVDAKLNKLEDELINKYFDKIYDDYHRRNPVMIFNGKERDFDDIFGKKENISRHDKLIIIGLEIDDDHIGFKLPKSSLRVKE